MKWLKLSNILIAIIFLSAFTLLVFSAKSDSVTTDESVHLFAGYTYLTRGDFRLDPEHPPVLKEIGAMPLVLLKSQLNDPIDGLWDTAANFYYDSWSEARKMAESFLFSLGNNADKIVFLGRLPFIFLTLFLGFFVFWWSKKIYGKKAATLAAFLILFLPSVLAHGHLINTDLGLSLFFFGAIYFWIKYLKIPSWLSLVIAGLFLGLTLASKFTGSISIVVLFFITIIYLAYYQKKLSIVKSAGSFIALLIIAFIIVWGSYGFSIEPAPVPISSLSANINRANTIYLPATLDRTFNILRPIIVPAEYFKGLILLSKHALGGHSAFLMGMNSNTGWWYYFPVTIFYKTPLPFLMLLIFGFFYKRKKFFSSFDEAVLIIAPIGFLAVSMLSKADLGIRHVLPIFPFLAVLASKSITLIDFKKASVLTVGFFLVVFWYLASVSWTKGNYIAYFNEFAQGPNGGYRILTDSNLDWGQDLLRIKHYVEENEIRDAYIVYPWNGQEALKYYGLNFKPLLPSDLNAKGQAIVSATYYQTDAYSWLKDHPFKKITPGVFLIDLGS